MGVPVVITDMSATAASNSPAGSDSIGTSLDDYIRSHAAFIRQLGNGTGFIHGADVASASTLNLDTSTGELVDVTGTTTITAITLAEGAHKTVRFTGALTLTNGASLVLPGAANITTVAGDYAIFRGYAAGVVRCVYYTPRLDLLTAHGADIASASTVNLDSATGDLVDVTGTTTITAITLAEGRCRTVRFTGILTLTHGSSLVLPNATSITTAAGDYAIFRGYAAGVARCVSYSPLAATTAITQAITDSSTKIATTAFVKTAPTIQRLTSGSSATYTTPSGVLWLKVSMVGGGGGGGAAGTGGSAGTTGGDTSFGSWVAKGGTGGQCSTNATAVAGGTGGANGTGTLINRVGGGAGSGASTTADTGVGIGGSSYFGGAGGGVSNPAAGNSATTNSGSGGGGATVGGGTQVVGGGGGSGEYVEFIVTSPSATYTYTIGSSGAGGTGGSQTGGAGGAGVILVEEYYIG